MQFAMLEKLALSSDRRDSSFMATAGNGVAFASFGVVFRLSEEPRSSGHRLAYRALSEWFRPELESGDTLSKKWLEIPAPLTGVRGFPVPRLARTVLASSQMGPFLAHS
jgi:hypothetical protein